MIGFATPELLFALPFAGVAAWRGLRRRRAAWRFSSLALPAGLPRGRARRAEVGGAALRGIGLAVLILAAAGPRTPDERTRLSADGIAIVFALDVSGSMAAPDFPPGTRLAAVKAAFTLFTAGGPAPDGPPFPGRPADQIGLVAFAAVPRTVCPLTLHHAALLQLLDAEAARDGVDAGTNIGDAVAEGVIRLEAAGDRRKVLILLSDGEHNVVRDGPAAPLKPREAAQLAHALGIPIYAIDCGPDPAATADPDAAQQRADGRITLAAVAALTGGRSFAARDPAELREVYRQIDALERAPADAFQYRRYHDHAAGFAAAGLAVLGTLVLLERTRWRRLP